MYLAIVVVIIAVVFIIYLLIYLLRKWLQGGTCQSNARLDGKTVLITGANAGIGKETAIDMARRGATVVMACRNTQKGWHSSCKVTNGNKNVKVDVMGLDLASLKSIHEFADEFLQKYEKLHILINNAGTWQTTYTTTDLGIETTIGVNHFGHFVLTNLLLERMVQSAPGRIVNVSSIAHTKVKGINFAELNPSKEKFNHFNAYCQSKLANILFTKELNRKLAGTGITTYALHPGCIVTNIISFSSWYTFLFNIFGKSVKQGAQTTIHCAVAEGIEGDSGQYFSDCAVKKSSAASYDEGAAKKLWEVSEEMTDVVFPL